MPAKRTGSKKRRANEPPPAKLEGNNPVDNVAKRLACTALIMEACKWTHVKFLEFTDRITEGRLTKPCPFDRQECTAQNELLKELFNKSKKIVEGKQKLHEFLKGEDPEAKHLTQLKEALEAIRVKAHNRLKNVNSSTTAPVDRARRYREIKKDSRPILTGLRQLLKQATTRYNHALADACDITPEGPKRELVQTEPESFEWEKCTVISFDLKDYTTHARHAQTWARTPKVVFEFNKSLLADLHTALAKVAGVQASESWIDGTGDGALVFCRDTKAAVKFAMKVRSSSWWTNAGIEEEEWKQHVRIGIATGPLAGEMSKDANGVITRFAVGGIVIILAVRNQAVCEPGSLVIDDVTKGQLNETVQSAFKTPQPEVKVKDWILPQAWIVDPTAPFDPDVH